MGTAGRVIPTVAALLLGALPLVAGDGNAAMNMSTGVQKLNPPQDLSMSYFRYGHHGRWMLAHSTLMILAWVVVFPVAIALSAARSRYHLPAQAVFHIVNGLGLFTGFVYNHATPDLYTNNAHHPIGWIVTSLTVVWTAASMYTSYCDYKSTGPASAQGQSKLCQAVARYARLGDYSDQSPPRPSRDSAMGSSRQSSSESVDQKPEGPQSLAGDEEQGEDDDEEVLEGRGFLGKTRTSRLVSRHVRRFTTPSVSRTVRFSQIVLEKLLLLLGFVAFTTGFVVYGGIAHGWQVLSILAHFIKGGLFFWYGLLTLGRWMGAFTEFGWAWNIRPDYPLVARWKARVPSAEFTESFVFWLYGASNVFLEHLNGGEWTPQDFEHLSITILFFGGGLLGMLIELPWAREMMNTTVVQQQDRDIALTSTARSVAGAAAATDEPTDQLWQEPATYKLPMNPMPGLVVMLLGILMAAHQQNSVASTMMHSQWGTLFFVFALARGVTYIMLYLKPPTSHYPARPPSELISAFCLISGGLLFMVSAHDTVWAIESNDLDAMTIFTVTLGLTGVVMAWEVVVFSIKGWAVRRERAAAGKAVAS
ncbi:hypothetical protein LTR36_006824 [Oleoguttula mirabilis]|uniref:Integral membrane protein n=1 Tax=Oleoguttula mirabilis TaxID=1507867 RepID=A0AAV9JBS6_9PEZI|nr:hypothetical protein LTR36_006824 [Oleoguttula mirabilis]